LEEGAASAESRGVQTELRLDSLLSVDDGQTYSANGGDMSLDPAQHHASPNDNGFMDQGEGLASSSTAMLDNPPQSGQEEHVSRSIRGDNAATSGFTTSKLFKSYSVDRFSHVSNN